MGVCGECALWRTGSVLVCACVGWQVCVWHLCVCVCGSPQTCTASRRLVGMVEERRNSQAVGCYGGYCRLCEISTVSQMRYFLGLIPSTGSGKLNLVLESLLLDLGILVANRSIQVPDPFETHS